MVWIILIDQFLIYSWLNLPWVVISIVMSVSLHTEWILWAIHAILRSNLTILILIVDVLQFISICMIIQIVLSVDLQVVLEIWLLVRAGSSTFKYHFIFKSLNVSIDLIIIIIKDWSEVVFVLWMLAWLIRFDWICWFSLLGYPTLAILFARLFAARSARTCQVVLSIWGVFGLIISFLLPTRRIFRCMDWFCLWSLAIQWGLIGPSQFCLWMNIKVVWVKSCLISRFWTLSTHWSTPTYRMSLILIHRWLDPWILI